MVQSEIRVRAEAILGKSALLQRNFHCSELSDGLFYVRLFVLLGVDVPRGTWDNSATVQFQRSTWNMQLADSHRG